MTANESASEIRPTMIVEARCFLQVIILPPRAWATRLAAIGMATLIQAARPTPLRRIPLAPQGMRIINIILTDTITPTPHLFPPDHPLRLRYGRSSILHPLNVRRR